MNAHMNGLIALGVLIFLIAIVLIVFLVYGDDYEENSTKQGGSFASSLWNWDDSSETGS